MVRAPSNFQHFATDSTICFTVLSVWQQQYDGIALTDFSTQGFHFTCEILKHFLCRQLLYLYLVNILGMHDELRPGFLLMSYVNCLHS